MPSITNELKSSGSPLRVLLDPHRELLRRMKAQAVAKLSGRPWIRLPNPSLASMAGHAIDTRARWLLTGIDELPDAVVSGLAFSDPATRQVVLDAFAAVRGLDIGLRPDRERDIAVAALAGAAVEPLYRAGPGVFCPLDGLTIDQFTERYREVVDDVVVLAAGLPALLPSAARALVNCGPVVGIGDLSGDADLLVAGELIEIKAVHDPKEKLPRTLQQMLVYCARIRPESATIVLPRQHSKVTFDMRPLAQLLEDLDRRIIDQYASPAVPS